MAASTTLEPLSTVERPLDRPWPAQLTIEVDRETIELAESMGHQKQPKFCPIARAALAALTETTGQHLAVNAYTDPSGHGPVYDVTIEVCQAGEPLGNGFFLDGLGPALAYYRLPGKAKAMHQWDEGMPMEPFRATIELVP